MAKNARRLQFKFWLDTGRVDDAALIDDIDQLKTRRQFTQTIRDGLRLMIDLRRGNVGVLLELFPDIADRLTAQQQAAPADLMAKLTRIESALGSVQIAPNADKPRKLDAPDVDALLVETAAPTGDGDEFDSLLDSLGF